MNQIAAPIQPSEFAKDPHPVINIDGVPLDALLAEVEPDLQHNGMVPVVLHWLYDEREQRIFRDRIVPPDGDTTIVPVQMCPDDCDFWCHLVVAEVEADDKIVRWNRLGNDVSEDPPEGVGSTVKWIAGVGPFEFDRQAYEDVVTTLLEFDRDLSEEINDGASA